MARPPAYQLGRIGVRRRDKSDAGVGRRETGAGLLADKKVPLHSSRPRDSPIG